MKVFVVNMEKDADRKEHVLKECSNKGIVPEIISAVDGRLIPDNELQELVHPGLSCGLTPSEIGCALSHLKIYNKIIAENISLALVLEDDVKLDESFIKVLSALEKTDFSSPTVILLSEVRRYIPFGKTRIDDKFTLVNTTQASLSHCYVINLAGAKALAKFLTPVWLEADRWTFFRECEVVNMKAVIPPVGHLSTMSETSTIWPTQQELNAKDEIRIRRAKTIKLIRKRRTMRNKVKNALWRLFIRKLFEAEGVK